MLDLNRVPSAAITERMQEMLEFFLAIDELKSVHRKNHLANGSRVENTAEHSWHLAVAALVFAELAPPETDVFHAMRIALIHDIVEIDAGDTFAYDTVGAEDKAEREQLAADRIFGILPTDLAQQFRSWWDEYEDAETNEAKFAAAIDRMSPMLLNMAEGGTTWRQFGVTATAARNRNRPSIETGMPDMWPILEALMTQNVESGALEP